MDPLATFQNTQRSISVSFDVVAPGLGDALQNTAMVDHLLSFLYPSYNELGQSDSNRGEKGRHYGRPPWRKHERPHGRLCGRTPGRQHERPQGGQKATYRHFDYTSRPM